MSTNNDKLARFIPVIAILGALLYLGSLYNKATSKKEGNTLREETTKTEISTAYDDSGSTNYEASKTCSWCSKSFTGTHYTHLGKMSDCTSSTDPNSIGKYCSMRCCSESRRKSCPTCLN